MATFLVRIRPLPSLYLRLLQSRKRYKTPSGCWGEKGFALSGCACGCYGKVRPGSFKYGCSRLSTSTPSQKDIQHFTQHCSGSYYWLCQEISIDSRSDLGGGGCTGCTCTPPPPPPLSRKVFCVCVKKRKKRSRKNSDKNRN